MNVTDKVRDVRIVSQHYIPCVSVDVYKQARCKSAGSRFRLVEETNCQPPYSGKDVN